jgi:prephenate dehydrogenase
MITRITIIGLGKIGTSIGLAIKRSTEEFSLTGFDRFPAVAKRALSIKAIDQISNRINDCVKQADVIILAVPVDEVIITIDTITPLLKPNAILIDTSPIKVNLIEYIDNKISENLFFLSIYPAINPKYINELDNSIESAHEDLFQNSVIAIFGSAKISNDAFKFGTHLIDLLGSKVLIVDPYEIEGLITTTELLPKILSTAFIHTVMDQSGWKEGRKFANPSFLSISQLISYKDEREEFGEASFLNSENVDRTINDMINELRIFQKMLKTGDKSAMKEWFITANKSHKNWVEERNVSFWNKIGESESVTTSGNFLSTFFGYKKKQKK